MISDPTERIAVLRTDLERLLEVLRWAHGHFKALDLADNYRIGRPDKEYSRMTRLTAQTHDRLEGYLNDGTLDQSTDELSEE